MNDNKSKTENLIKVAQEKEEARLIINMKHIENGVSFIDCKAAYIDETVVIGSGTVIEPGVILQGKTVIGQDCIIGHIGNQVDIQTSVILKSQVGNRSKVGPFAYIRPDSLVGEDAKVGDFVEVKNSTIGNGSKASHLTYIGDSQVGDGVNLGCGVIFVNYDGKKKSRSIIKDGAFIGCNTNLISPVTVGEGAYVAAGTTVTEDVPSGALCIGRVKNRHIEGWVKKRGLLKHK